jgi:hypothetical protein
MSKEKLDTIQSNLSFSYLHAVVSGIGGSCVRLDQTADNMGIDVILTFRGDFSSEPTFRKISISVQLKSTRQILTVSKGRISYPLNAKQYNKYLQKSTTEFLFVLFVLPEDQKMWLELSPQELILRKCCYWTSLNGASPSTADNVTVHFPEQNLFNGEQLQKILAILSEGGRLKYEP